MLYLVASPHLELAFRGGAGPPFARRPGGPPRLASVLGMRDQAPRRVVVNERTTAAAGFALAQFMSRRGIAGKSPGLQNAVGMAHNLVDPRRGRPAVVLRRKPNGRQTDALRTFNSLANLIAPCVRHEARCERLFRLTAPPRGRRPHGSLEAIASIARNPSQNVGRLFSLARSSPAPYRPALRPREKPDAWTLALRFDGDGRTLNGPGNFAIDGEGSVWVSNNYEYAANPEKPVCASEKLLRFTPDGRFYPGSPYEGGGLSGVGFGIAIDPEGDVWVSNFGFAGEGCDEEPVSTTLSKFARNGTALSPDATASTTGGFDEWNISFPQGTESDPDGGIWVANCGNDTVTLYPRGDPAAARNFSGLGLDHPFDLAINGAGRVFVTSTGNDRVAVVKPSGEPIGASPLSGAGLSKPLGIAVDSRGHMWVANSGLIELPCPDRDPPGSSGGSLTLIGNRAVPETEGPFEGGGLTIPWGIAVDGDDNVWVANFAGKRLSQFCGRRKRTCPPGTKTGDPISPNRSGFSFDGLVRNTGVAVDPSGNVWLANNWATVPLQTNPGGHQIVAFVGAAPPLQTPLIGPPARD